MERENFYFERDPEELSAEEAREAVVALRRLLERDPLLPTMLNKAAVERRVAERVGMMRRFGLFMIDLDRFKRYNDTFGHPAGDDLLRQLEQLFQIAFRREGDSTLRAAFESGRYGGDEFLLMIDLDLPNTQPISEQRTSDPEEQMDNAEALLRRIEARLLKENPRAATAGVGLSIGGAVFDPRRPVSARMLIDQADEAMYEDKTEPRS